MDSVRLNSYALEMSHISKTFGRVKALDDVSLKITQGAIHGLIGQNGAGKSTLMKILSGFYPAGSFDGNITLAGKEVQLRSPRDAQNFGIAIVPQEITIAGTLTVAENILLTELGSKRVKYFSKKQSETKVQSFLDSNHIPLRGSQLADTLTLPQKQILMIASAIYAQPKVLVLDEPTSSLTADEIGTLFSMVRSLKERGFTTVFITHKLSEIVDLCDEVSILRDGRVAYECKRQDFNTDILVENMIGRSLGDLYPEKNILDPNAEILLSIRDLIVENPRQPGEKILEEFSFDLRAGEVLGLGGLLGSGRTEILKSLYRDNRILSGAVELSGNEEFGRSTSKVLQAGICYITEDRKAEGLFFNLPIRPNLTAKILDKCKRMIFLNRKAEKQLANESSQALDVKPADIETSIGNLSGGNQQKVLIGKGLLTNPKILMLDEPTKGVDIASKAEIYQIVHNLAEKGVGIILVSSEFPELLELSHRVLVFSGGKLQGEMLGNIENEHDLMLMSIGGK